uniref:ISXO2-like transposase domain-containing protein n=1 Tax=Octopus bimaculoides TaxID=37653 RepID=A0A0L8GD66_OCTBM
MSVDWRSFCCEVCLHWVENCRAQIGGPGIAVEIDEAVLVRRKYNRGRLVKTIWLFGGIEHKSKKQFLMPLSSECHGLYSTIQTIIYSDCWGAYSSLQNLGYTHFQINHRTSSIRQTR